MDAGSSILSSEANNGNTNTKLLQHPVEHDESKMPSYTNLPSLQKPSSTELKLESIPLSVLSAMTAQSGNYHGIHYSNAGTNADGKTSNEILVSTKPGITINDQSSRDFHSHQGHTGLQPSKSSRNLGHTLDMQRLSTIRTISHSPISSPASPNTQSIQVDAKPALRTESKADAVSKEVAASFVQNLSEASLQEIQQAIKARVLHLVKSDGNRKRKAERAGAVETPGSKRRVACDQCNKTMVRHCDLRYSPDPLQTSLT